MPDWVKDEDKWKKAKEKVKEINNKKETDFTDRDWGLVTHIYKNMDGKIGSKPIKYEFMIASIVKEAKTVAFWRDKKLLDEQALKPGMSIKDAYFKAEKALEMLDRGKLYDLRHFTHYVIYDGSAKGKKYPAKQMG